MEEGRSLRRSACAHWYSTYGGGGCHVVDVYETSIRGRSSGGVMGTEWNDWGTGKCRLINLRSDGHVEENLEKKNHSLEICAPETTTFRRIV